MNPEQVETPKSVKDIFDMPYNEVSQRYQERLRLLEQKEEEFRSYRQKETQYLRNMLHKYVVGDGETADMLEPRIESFMESMAIMAIGYGSPQSRYANSIRGRVEEALKRRHTSRNTDRSQIAEEIMRTFKDLEPNFQLSTDTFAVDPGLRQTAAVVTVDSLARGSDENGRPIPGELHMNGYPIIDLVEHTDFVGSVGLMLKKGPLTQEEHAKLQRYMTSQATLTEDEERLIDMNMRNLSKNPKFNARLLMNTVNQLTLYFFGKNEFIDLSDTTTDEENKFYSIADQGLTVAGKVLAGTAYALRQLMEKKGEELGEMPDGSDPRFNWGGNFLRFLYGEQTTREEGFGERADALDIYFQLIRTHGAGNASTFSARVAGSAHASLYNALSSGNNALSGDRHGFANYLVREQVDPIYERLKKENEEITDQMIRREIDKIWEGGEKFQGIGHPVYNNDPEGMLSGDPRKGIMEEIIASWDIPELNEKLAFYQGWEQQAVSKLEEETGRENQFSANVDFLTPLVLQDRVGLPLEANTAMFEDGRVFGHLSNYMEAIQFGLIRSKTHDIGVKGRGLP